jgi:hypothetical protein
VHVFWGACTSNFNCRQGVEELEECGPPEIPNALVLGYDRNGWWVSLATGAEGNATFVWHYPHGDSPSYVVRPGEKVEMVWAEDPGEEIEFDLESPWLCFTNAKAALGEEKFEIFLPIVFKAPIPTPTPTPTMTTGPTAIPTATPTPTFTPPPTPTPTPTPTITPTPPPMPDPSQSLIKGWQADATSTYPGETPGMANDGDLATDWAANWWAPQSWWAEGGPVDLEEGVWLMLHQASRSHVRGEVKITYTGGESTFPFEGTFGDGDVAWIAGHLERVTKVEVSQHENSTSWPGLFEVVAK